MGIKWKKAATAESENTKPSGNGGKPWTVTFNTNADGVTVEAQTVANKKKAKEPEEPKREGYDFGGWFKDESLTEAYDFNSPVTADTTLYAKWTESEPASSGNESGTNGGNAEGDKE